MTSRLTILAAVLAAFLALAPAASARTNIAVGLGDQDAGMFDHPAYKDLKLKKVRYFVRWDAMRVAYARQQLDQFVDGARRNGARVFVHISTNDFRDKRAKLPSRSRYRRDVGRLVRHLRRKGVREFGVWNEANHKTQPTWDNPRRAAQYFRDLKRVCRGCTIVGLDVLDQRGVERYIRRWFAALPRSYRRSKLRVGIHNYSDTNRRRSSGTRSIIRTVRRYNRRASFWLTETGGVVNFGRSFPCNERRAASRLGYMFTLARKYRRYIDRLYAYNWTGADCSGFDAGLTRRDGSLRPAYNVFKSRLRSFAR